MLLIGTSYVQLIESPGGFISLTKKIPISCLHIIKCHI